MKIAFFGLPLAAHLLGLDGHDLRLVVLSPVSAPGRRRVEQRWGRQRVLAAADLGQALTRQVDRRLAECGADLIVSWYWTRRILERWLERAPLGGLGVHPSLLPRHRGPNPFFWAIDAGDAVTGVTVHRLTEEYDAGPIVDQACVPVGDRNAWQLARALDRPSLERLRDVLRRMHQGVALNALPQDENAATQAPEPTGELLRVDWTWSTDRVLRRVQALAPVPGLALEIGQVPLFVTRAGPAKRFVRALWPGEAAVDAKGFELVIRTGDGAIRVERAVLGCEAMQPGRELDGAALAALIAPSRDEVLDCAPPSLERPR